MFTAPRQYLAALQAPASALIFPLPLVQAVRDGDTQRHDTARHSTAQRGTAWPCKVQHGMKRQGKARQHLPVVVQPFRLAIERKLLSLFSFA